MCLTLKTISYVSGHTDDSNKGINMTQLSDWRRKWQPTPVFLPGESHGQRSLVGYSPWGCKESDTTEQLHFHLSLSCIGEGNSNLLQCSCLENPSHGGAWWAAVYGVAQSRTRLKRLSSSSSNISGTSSPRMKSVTGMGLSHLHVMVSIEDTYAEDH